MRLAEARRVQGPADRAFGSGWQRMTSSAAETETRAGVSETASVLRKALLLCGLLSSLLYVATDLLAGVMWEGYSFTDQAISELSAIGAPTRSLVVPLLLVYNALVVAFGLAVWGTDRNRALRFTGGLLIGMGALGFVWTAFPIQLPPATPTWTDTVHSILAGVNVLLFLLAMGFGALAFGRRFRFYSFGTVLTLLVFGAASFLMAGGQIAGQGLMEPPPWFGLIERVDAYACMLWVAVLGVVLGRAGTGPAPIRMQATWGTG